MFGSKKSIDERYTKMKEHSNVTTLVHALVDTHVCTVLA